MCNSDKFNPVFPSKPVLPRGNRGDFSPCGIAQKLDTGWPKTKLLPFVWAGRQRDPDELVPKGGSELQEPDELLLAEPVAFHGGSSSPINGIGAPSLTVDLFEAERSGGLFVLNTRKFTR